MVTGGGEREPKLLREGDINVVEAGQGFYISPAPRLIKLGTISYSVMVDQIAECVLWLKRVPLESLGDLEPNSHIFPSGDISLPFVAGVKGLNVAAPSLPVEFSLELDPLPGVDQTTIRLAMTYEGKNYPGRIDPPSPARKVYEIEPLLRAQLWRDEDGTFKPALYNPRRRTLSGAVFNLSLGEPNIPSQNTEAPANPKRPQLRLVR